MCNQLWRLDDKGARSLADPLLAHVNGHKGGQVAHSVALIMTTCLLFMDLLAV